VLCATAAGVERLAASGAAGEGANGGALPTRAFRWTTGFAALGTGSTIGGGAIVAADAWAGREGAGSADGDGRTSEARSERRGIGLAAGACGALRWKSGGAAAGDESVSCGALCAGPVAAAAARAAPERAGACAAAASPGTIALDIGER
jgi:hypothetical protein